MPALPSSARRLRSALVPTGRRPNPAEETARPWRLQQRHAEGGDWWTVEEAIEPDVLRDWVAGPPDPPHYGDLVRLLSPRRTVRGFWVQGREGLLDAGPVSPALNGSGYDWSGAWEGTRADVNTLLRASVGVDRRRLVLAACDCAEAVLDLVPEGEARRRTRSALAAARRWTRGESGVRAVLRAQRAVELVDEDGRALWAQRAARDAAGVVEAPSPSNAAASAGAAAAYAYAGSNSVSENALRALAPLVRRWIPLSIALLGRAGEPTPPDLVL